MMLWKRITIVLIFETMVQGVMAAQQSQCIITRQNRYLADWKRCHAVLRDNIEQAKQKQVDLETVVAALRADLVLKKKQLDSKEFELCSKKAELAMKEKESVYKGSELEKRRESWSSKRAN